MTLAVDILSRPAGTAARVTLQPGESLTAEVGAMIAMTDQVTVETTTSTKGGGGGLIKGIKRMFAGENFFLNHFTANAENQQVLIGPALMGDIVEHTLSGGHLIVQGSSWLASSSGIDLDASWQGFGKALFSGERMFWVRCSGSGAILLNSFGAIYEVEVNGNYVVDTGHIVAFEDSLSFSIGKASSSWLGSFASGEGLVSKFSGTGKLYCQSHNPPSFGRILGPKLRPRRE